ncbi:MAG: sigma 54-interacting transcriptional regulator [Bacteroidetes bacterium]|nr:sigma 54-interacting transcriptional regulator [Bacteroidota bacterium]
MRNRSLLKIDPEIYVITITAYGDVSLAVKALKLGASDFVLKPWDNTKLVADIESGVKLRHSRIKAGKSGSTTEGVTGISQTEKQMIGESPSFKEVMSLVQKVAQTDVNVLITGENGTGKELIAREIHRLSGRNKKTLISVDLGAITSSLFESELFGHMKGAFTDAVNDRKGKFERLIREPFFLTKLATCPWNHKSSYLPPSKTG